MKNNMVLFVSLILPLCCTCLYLTTLSRLYVIYDMGINSTANLGGLIFITTPIMTITFTVTTIVTLVVARKTKVSKSKALVFEMVILLFVFCVVFIYEFWSLRDYPVSKPYNLFYFLSNY
jgi:hypothetical protein